VCGTSAARASRPARAGAAAAHAWRAAQSQ